MHRINPFNWVDPSKRGYIPLTFVGAAATIYSVALAALKKGTRYEQALSLGCSVMAFAYGVYQLTRRPKTPPKKSDTEEKPTPTTGAPLHSSTSQKTIGKEMRVIVDIVGELKTTCEEVKTGMTAIYGSPPSTIPGNSTSLTASQSTSAPLGPPPSLQEVFQQLKKEINNTPHFDPTKAWESINGQESPMSISISTHAHKIFEHVYLGDYAAFLSVDPVLSANKEFLKTMQNETDRVGCSDKNIKTVISLHEKDRHQNTPYRSFSFNSRCVDRTLIDVKDAPEAWEILEKEFDVLFEKIDHALSNKTNILLHCVQGQTRSACVLCAYLINRCKVSFEQAYNFLQSKRHQVSFEINVNIKTGLKAYASKHQV